MTALPPGVQPPDTFQVAPQRPPDAGSQPICPAHLLGCDQAECWRRGEGRGESFCVRLERARGDVMGADWIDPY